MLTIDEKIKITSMEIDRINGHSRTEKYNIWNKNFTDWLDIRVEMTEKEKIGK